MRALLGHAAYPRGQGTRYRPPPPGIARPLRGPLGRPLTSTYVGPWVKVEGTDQRMRTMAKLTFLAGLAAGYVLGAKAGQKRYQQIKTQTDRVWGSAPVQARVDTVKQVVTDQAPVVAARVA